MRIILTAVLFIGAAAAQTFTLGTASDPCTGGMAYPQPPGSMVSPIPTLRYSLNSPTTGGLLPFSCSFTAAAGAGAYVVELDFVEPAAFVPASDPMGRAFSVALTDAWGAQAFGSMNNVDLFTMGAASSAVVIARNFLVFSSDGKIKVTLTPLKRSAVISRVVITPLQLGPLLASAPGAAALATRQPHPSGLDLITFLLPDGSKRYEIGSAVWQSMLTPSQSWGPPARIADIPAPVAGK